MSRIICTNCHKSYNEELEKCPKCGCLTATTIKINDTIRMLNKQAREEKRQQKQKQQQTTQYQVKCPFCGSPDVRKITQFNRAMGSLFFGFNSPNHGKQWNCRNCDSFF